MTNITRGGSGKQAHTPLAFLPVNRNLMYHPIARGERTKLKWTRNWVKGFRRCRISDRVSIKLPLSSEIRRHATGFDVAVLLTLTALAKARTATLRLSASEILLHMRSPITSRTRAKVATSLKFWTHASLEWDGGWMSNRKRLALKFSPPIALKGELLEVCPLWMMVAADRYFERLPPSLPLDAATQNLCLLILSKRRADGEPGEREFVSKRQVTRLIGLTDAGDRNRRLDETVEKAEQWFDDQGGQLRWFEDRQGIIKIKFKAPFMDPHLPR